MSSCQVMSSCEVRKAARPSMSRQTSDDMESIMEEEIGTEDVHHAL